MAEVSADHQFVIDNYSTLSHKSILGGDPFTTGSTGVNGRGYLTPSYVPFQDRRRLAAYLIRSMYLGNVARYMMAFNPGPDAKADARKRAANREYGDPELLVERLRAAVLGDTYTFVIDGADENLDDLTLPEEPPAPSEVVDGEGPGAVLARRVAQIRLQRWTDEVSHIVDTWAAKVEAQPTLRDLQAKLDDWVDRSQLRSHINECEHDSIGLGDGIYVLWPQKGNWPKVQVFDPDSYFPVLPTNGDSVEFPRKINFCWEFSVWQDGKVTFFVRRLTFELVTLTSIKARDFGGRIGVAWLNSDGEPTSEPLLADNETIDAQGVFRRRYPWQAEDEEPSEWTCIFSDGTWKREDSAGLFVDAFADDKATWAARNLDMGFDFMPVIHDPGTPEGKHHFGRAAIDVVAQVFDDIQRNDSDVQTAASYLAAPTIALSGAKADDRTARLGPGMIMNVGDNGHMDVLDLTAGVERLAALGDRLQDRCWQNARMPLRFMGRASIAAASSGIQVALEFAPLSQVVGIMRMARDPKYRLLLKQAMRMAQVQGVIEPGELPTARLVFGSFLPTDKAGAVTMVTQALQAHAISHQTAIMLLISAGFDIDDARAELERIQQEDTAAAVAVYDATGSAELAANRLGLDLPTPAGPGPAPVIKLPPPGGGGPPA